MARTRIYNIKDHRLDVVVKKFGGTKHMPTPDNISEVLADYPVFDFRKVPSNLNATFTRVHREVPGSAELRDEDVDWVLFNMSYGRIQRQWLRDTNIPETKSLFNIEEYGNCGAASLGLVLHDFMRSGQTKPGDLALLMGVGSGLQFGGVLYRFG